MKSLDLFPLDFHGHVPAPEPTLNGGRYTGEPFHADAPYRNFPAMPDGAYMLTANLLSAGPPAAAVRQPPPGANLRPGNNRADYPLKHFHQYRPQNNLFCASTADDDSRCMGTADQTPAPTGRFAKFAAW